MGTHGVDWGCLVRYNGSVVHNPGCSHRDGGVTMPATMAKRKSQSASRHVEPRETFHLPQELLDALVRCVNDTRPETTKSAVIRSALEDYLTARGYWPASGQKGGA